jgi:hypothetical protein
MRESSNPHPIIWDSQKEIPMRRSLIVAVALVASTMMSHAQVELKNYADAKGYIDVQKLTCAQLAGTFQEDADFLGVWYSGWYNAWRKNTPSTWRAQRKAFTT